MTIEDHLRRMIGDLFLTTAKLASDVDALTEKLKAAGIELPPPSPPPPDKKE